MKSIRDPDEICEDPTMSEDEKLNLLTIQLDFLKEECRNFQKAIDELEGHYKHLLSINKMVSALLNR